MSSLQVDTAAGWRASAHRPYPYYADNKGAVGGRTSRLRTINFCL